MDIVFNCPFCNQELQVDEAGAGAEIPCPACNETLLVPSAEFSNLVPTQAETPEASAPAAPPAAPITNKDTRSVAMAQRAAAPAEIQKPAARSLDAAARGDKRARVKTFRRQECMKDGKDRFDESVNEFLQKVGGDNIIAIHPITYSYPAKEGNQMLTDYGVIVHYKA
jgi:hypothetical protein